MSIYKDNPSLSVDFVIFPFEVAFSSVVEEYRVEALELSSLRSDDMDPLAFQYHSEFDTENKRLYYSPKLKKFALGRSNTQHNSGRPEKLQKTV